MAGRRRPSPNQHRSSGGGPLFNSLIDLELRAWSRRGRRPNLWWRDDDARAPSPMLDRLLRLAERHGVPIALAIIPDGDLAALAPVLAPCPSVFPIQHGCDHRDRGVGISAEFGDTASVEEIARAVNGGWNRLSALPRATPIYAPPWNVVTANVLAALDETPIRAVSLYGAQEGLATGLPLINSHVDIMRWRPARYRGTAAILGRIWRQLRARRRAGRWEAPIGLLTHHRNLDASAWRFLEGFLDRWAGPDSPIRWRSARELVAEPGMTNGDR